MGRPASAVRVAPRFVIERPVDRRPIVAGEVGFVESANCRPRELADAHRRPALIPCARLGLILHQTQQVWPGSQVALIGQRLDDVGAQRRVIEKPDDRGKDLFIRHTAERPDCCAAHFGFVAAIHEVEQRWHIPGVGD